MAVIVPRRLPPDAEAANRGVLDLLSTLDAEQSAAATLPDGPAQIIAPAGSGKTTTLIARLGVLLSRGVDPDRIAVVTFNREAAQELRDRVRARLAPLVPDAERIEIRTLHALARQILLDAGSRLQLVSDRLPLLRAARRRCQIGRSPDAPPLPEVAVLDTWLSAWKVERRPPPPDVEPVLASYQALLDARHACDFDDLVVLAADSLERDARLRMSWQRRFSHLCVDEFQDVDAAQLRLVRILAEPERNLFVVGDDDQTIYAWRLADVRRILDFSVAYPSASRVLLATNYRCPERVVAVSARLISVNRERFAKRIIAGRRVGRSEHRKDMPGSASVAAVSTAVPDWPDHVLALAAAAATNGARACLLARTRAELSPIVLAAVRAGVPHAMTIPAPLDSASVQALETDLEKMDPSQMPFAALLRLRASRGWRRSDEDDALGDEDHAALDAFIGWSTGFSSIDSFRAARQAMGSRLAILRRPDASVELITVHAAKGREWETVIVLGFEEERFPNRRALVEATNPERAVEEERRLAYVAVTRATRRLILAFDPKRPSRFLAEMGFATRSD